MLKGQVRWFDGEKGYGMIKPADGDGLVFVHNAAVVGGEGSVLTIGEWVEFEMIETPHGPRAINVRKIAPPDDRG